MQRLASAAGMTATAFKKNAYNIEPALQDGTLLKDLIVYSPDCPELGIVKCDFMLILSDPMFKRAFYEPLIKAIEDEKPDVLLTLTGDGRAIGEALSILTDTPTVKISKWSNKVSPEHDIVRVDYYTMYGRVDDDGKPQKPKSLYVYEGMVPKGAKAMIVDDDGESLGTMAAAYELAVKAGSQPVGGLLLSQQRHKFEQLNIDAMRGMPLHSAVTFTSDEEMRGFANRRVAATLLEQPARRARLRRGGVSLAAVKQ